MKNKQEIKEISLSELQLWAENPREPITSNSSNTEIIKNAYEDRNDKWKLHNLIEKMGEYFDFSEIPTVTYINNIPVVLDGNRRVAVGMLKNGIVSVEGVSPELLPSYPEKIPCNVCEFKTALTNVRRKHSESGSWSELDRDLFDHKYMNSRKSNLLIFDEATGGLVRNNPHMNQRFVHDEILKDSSLQALGFKVVNGSLETQHSVNEADAILLDLSNKIKDKELSTRKNRGKALEVLEKESRSNIKKNASTPFKKASLNISQTTSDKSKSPSKRTRRIQPKEIPFFRGSLNLKAGDVNNLYRDIEKTYQIFISERLSKSFIGVIRMALRLIIEQAATDKSNKMGVYISNNFNKAKKELNSNEKTFLVTQNVDEKTLPQLLNTGAHNYSSSLNVEQCKAMSLIIGSMLQITHKK